MIIIYDLFCDKQNNGSQRYSVLIPGTYEYVELQAKQY